jgi:type IV pilus assembly protein PilX
MKGPTMIPPLPPTRLPHQRGVALFVVIVFVLMSMLLALWASRTSLFNEMVVGNDADYQRAYEAAQILLQDAEMDIRSSETDDSNKTLDGVDCSPGGKICRIGLGDFQIPATREGDKVDSLINALAGQNGSDRCRYGLCTKRTGAQDFWNDKTKLQLISKNSTGNEVGARYGDYTGAKVGGATSANPILADRSAWNRGGWYWIEILPYTKSKAGQPTPPCNAAASSGVPSAPGGPTLLVGDKSDSTLRPNLDPAIIYRITALAYGRKVDDKGNPLTMAVIQSSYARSRCAD